MGRVVCCAFGSTVSAGDARISAVVESTAAAVSMAAVVQKVAAAPPRAADAPMPSRIELRNGQTYLAESSTEPNMTDEPWAVTAAQPT